jgi:hypothetical protein
MRIEISLVTREFITLEAEIDTFAVVTANNTTIWVLAHTLPTPKAVCLGKVGEQFLELRVVLEDRKERREPFSVDVEATQQFL